MDEPLDTPLEVPVVSPIGLLESPRGFVAAPRRHSPVRRLLAAALLALVALVTVLTTVTSLGSYCLTTEPGDVRPLPASLAHRAAGHARSGRHPIGAATGKETARRQAGSGPAAEVPLLRKET